MLNKEYNHTYPLALVCFSHILNTNSLILHLVMFKICNKFRCVIISMFFWASLCLEENQWCQLGLALTDVVPTSEVITIHKKFKFNRQHEPTMNSAFEELMVIVHYQSYSSTLNHSNKNLKNTPHHYFHHILFHSCIPTVACAQGCCKGTHESIFFFLLHQRENKIKIEMQLSGEFIQVLLDAQNHQ